MLIRTAAADFKSIAITSFDKAVNEFQEGEFLAHDFAYRADLRGYELTTVSVPKKPLLGKIYLSVTENFIQYYVINPEKKLVSASISKAEFRSQFPEVADDFIKAIHDKNDKVLKNNLSQFLTVTIPREHTFDLPDNLKINKKYYRLFVPRTLPGLICYILVPKNAKDPEIKVIFRGTQCRYSIQRNLEYGGAGNLSFERCKTNILNKINAAIKIHAQKAKLEQVSIAVYGHSLGGADAQNCVAALMDQLVRHSPKAGDKLIKSSPSFFSYITSIKMMAYNATGVTNDTAIKAKQDAATLSSRGIRISCYWQLVAGDGVQQTGEASILSDVDQAIATVHLLKVTYNNLEEKIWQNSFAVNQAYYAFMNALPAHTNFCHKPGSTISNREYFVNTSPSAIAIIHNKLAKKNTFLQTRPLRLLQFGLYHIINIGLKFSGSTDVTYFEDPLADPFLVISPADFKNDSVSTFESPVTAAARFFNQLEISRSSRFPRDELFISHRYPQSNVKLEIDGKSIPAISHNAKLNLIPIVKSSSQSSFSKLIENIWRFGYAGAMFLSPIKNDEKSDLMISPAPPVPSATVSVIPLLPAAVLPIGGVPPKSDNKFKLHWKSCLLGAVLGVVAVGAIFFAITATLGVGVIGFAILGAVVGGLTGQGINSCRLSRNKAAELAVIPSPVSSLSANARMNSALGMTRYTEFPRAAPLQKVISISKIESASPNSSTDYLPPLQTPVKLKKGSP